MNFTMQSDPLSTYRGILVLTESRFELQYTRTFLVCYVTTLIALESTVIVQRDAVITGTADVYVNGNLTMAGGSLSLESSSTNILPRLWVRFGGVLLIGGTSRLPVSASGYAIIANE